MLMIDFINVGYGDAILLRERPASGKNFTMLVDCGGTSTEATEPGSKRISSADFLEKEGIDRLDLLVITHLHLDHSGGLLRLLSQVDISQLWCNYVSEPALWGRQVQVSSFFSAGAKHLLDSINIYSHALNTLSGKDATIRCIQTDQPRLYLSEELYVYAFCEEVNSRQLEIWQHTLDGQVTGEELDDLDEFINDTSLRLRIVYAGRSIELPGDFSAARWEQYEQPECCIMKLPHHGHADSLTEPLAARLRADYTVVSVSNDRTDHCPAGEIAALAKRYSPHLLFTDAVTLPGISPVHHESVRFYIAGDGTITLEE